MNSQTFRALLGAALVLGAAGRCAASPYKITILDGNSGSLDPAQGQPLNDLGQVIGTWAQSPGPNGGGGLYPYFYDPTAGGKVSLPGMYSPSGQNPGAIQGGFSGLNDLGQAAGWNGQGTTILFDSKTGQTTNVLGPSGMLTNSGQIIGTDSTESPVGIVDPHPYINQNGTIQQLGIPPGAASATVAAVNNTGQIVVNSFMSSTNGQYHAFVLSGGKWTDLGTLVAAAINDQGTVAGSVVRTTGHAVLIPMGGSPIDLGTLPGDTSSAATAINNHGQVVGLSTKQNNPDFAKGFLYQNGVMTNLNSLIAASSGWTIKWGLSINDQGQILAMGDNGTSQDVLLLTPNGLPTPPNPVFPEKPVPEPSTIVVFGFLTAVAWRVYPSWGTHRHSA